MEKQLAHDMLQMTNFSPAEIDQIFAAIIDAPLDYFLKRFEEPLKEKYVNKVCASAK